MSKFMQRFLEFFDRLAGIEQTSFFAVWLERAVFFFLFLMIIWEPHSIAVTQSAWLIGTFLWFIRLFIKPRQKLLKTVLDLPLLAFFGWSLITSVFSYAPDISLDRLRGTLLLLIFYFVVNNVKNKRAAVFLALAMIFSCLVNVVWMPIERLLGRGVEIHDVAPDSPFAKALLINGDTLLKANDVKVKTPEDLLAQIENHETTKIFFYRPDFYFEVNVKKADLLNGAAANEKLGIGSWTKSHNWRSQGFYGHYTTYAEVLQLIGSLALGIFIALFAGKNLRPAETRLKWILFAGIAGIAFALLLTVTRAPQLAFVVSAFVMVLLGGNRKLKIALAIVAVPVIIGGLLFLNYSRNVGFFDAKDDSTTYRETVWREGFHLWTKNARNFTVGVGMDSISRYAKDWHLFDDGKLPQSHFHSTPLQMLVERGIFGLLIWLWIFIAYGWHLFKNIRDFESLIEWNNFDGTATLLNNPILQKGILLGCFGGLLGFFISSFVHYNFGDAEVVMCFYMLMGLAVIITKKENLNENKV